MLPRPENGVEWVELSIVSLRSKCWRYTVSHAPSGFEVWETNRATTGAQVPGRRPRLMATGIRERSTAMAIAELHAIGQLSTTTIITPMTALEFDDVSGMIHARD